MFEYAFVEAHGRPARPYTFMISAAGQSALIGLSILAPLVFVDALPQARWLVRLVAPPVPSRPVSTEAPVQPSSQPAAVRQSAGPAKLYEPRAYPAKPAILVDPEAAWHTEYAVGPGVPFATGDPGSVLTNALVETPKPAPPPPVTDAPVLSSASPLPPLVRVGGKVQAPAPLHTPPPEYPVLARQARVSGKVFLEAIIAADGRVRSLRLIQGHALLAGAAMTAVRSWRYTPPTLNGEPIEILMHVEVNFELGR
ncbi:MAG: TonB family protein [Bryobacteraceae bacterium]